MIECLRIRHDEIAEPEYFAASTIHRDGDRGSADERITNSRVADRIRVVTDDQRVVTGSARWDRTRSEGHQQRARVPRERGADRTEDDDMVVTGARARALVIIEYTVVVQINEILARIVNGVAIRVIE